MPGYKNQSRFVNNFKGHAQLRNHPTLIWSMEQTARDAVSKMEQMGRSFPDRWDPDERVEVWEHQGRKTGPRTSVQVWGVNKVSTGHLLWVFGEIRRSHPYTKSYAKQRFSKG